MQYSKLKTLANNDDNLYGFRLSSGREIVLAMTMNKDEVSEYPHDTITFDDTTECIKYKTSKNTPFGPQIELDSYIEATDIVEVLFFS